MRAEELALGSFKRAFPATESAGFPKLFTLPKHYPGLIPFVYHLVIRFPLLTSILMTYVNWYEENIIILKDKKWERILKTPMNVQYFSLNVSLKTSPRTSHWSFSLSFFFFSFIFISWRLITLHYCSGFCHTLTWISHGVTCIPHPDPPSHLPLYQIPLSLPSAPGPSTCLMHPTWAGDLFHHR